jgi:hypothetical protein
MSLRQQKWSPDTCGCVLLETWDDATDQAARVHTYHAVEHACPAHTHLSGEAVYQAVRGENRRKNLVAVIAKALHAPFEHADYTWSFDAQRRVVATVAGLSVGQQQALQQAADLQFGPGQVDVA